MLNRLRVFSAVSPAKSPAARAVMLWLDRSSVSVMAASSAAVTAAQSLTPGIRASSASRTAGVRPQMPAAVSLSLSVTVTVTLAITVSL